MSVTAEDINFLITRHLQENGYKHTAYVFSNECLLDETYVKLEQLPPQALFSIIQKGMLYMQLEKGINEKSAQNTTTDSIISSIIDDIHRQEPIQQPKTPQRPKTPVKPSQGIELPQSCGYYYHKHKNEVFCVAWSPNSKYLATAAHDSKAIIWKFNDDNLTTTYELSHSDGGDNNKKCVNCLAWNNTSEILATGCDDGSIRLWTNAGNLRFVLARHSGSVISLQFSPDDSILLSTPNEGQVLTWNAANGQVLGYVGTESNKSLDAEWCSATMFATIIDTTNIAICDIKSPEPKVVLRGHTKSINKISFDYSKTYLASCSDDCTICIWKPFEKITPIILDQHTDIVYTIKWSPSPSNQNILISCGYDKTVKVWDAPNGALLFNLTHHIDKVFTIIFSPKGKYFASSGSDKAIHVYKTQDGSHICTYKTTSTVFDSSWSPNGRMIAFAQFDASLLILSASSIPGFME